MDAICKFLCWLGFHNPVSCKGKKVCAACGRTLKENNMPISTTRRKAILNDIKRARMLINGLYTEEDDDIAQNTNKSLEEIDLALENARLAIQEA